MTIFTTMVESFTIYGRIALSSVKDVVIGWKFMWSQIVTLFLLGVVTFFLTKIGFVGSILLGILFSFALSFYLALIKAMVLREKFISESIKEEGFQLFSPIISCFFSLFLIQIIISVLKVPSFVSTVIAIFISVFLNPVIEVIYLEGGSFADIINRSISFVKEHFLIWFFPVFIFISPFVANDPRFLLEAFTSDPLSMLRSLIQGFSFSLNVLSLIPVLYFISFFLVFRGRLFSTIENKSRIKKWW